MHLLPADNAVVRMVCETLPDFSQTIRSWLSKSMKKMGLAPDARSALRAFWNFDKSL
jgi:hypothetical protein